MKKILFAFSFLLILCCAATVRAEWHPAGKKIKTRWAAEVDPSNVLPEYPRPQLVRDAWCNLNGLWEFSVTPVGAAEPTEYSERILVPFAVESSLSGIQRPVTENDCLWYKRTFEVPAGWKGRDVLLHFGAVDWRADVYVNDRLVGRHEGGFTPFSFDITPYLAGKGAQKLVVCVWDPTDKGCQPVGKQAHKPRGIWYTAVSGIWQTVWLEPVSDNHISGVKSIPDLDGNNIAVTVSAPKARIEDRVEITLLDNGKPVATAAGVPGSPVYVRLENAKLWSPDSPFLYDMKVVLKRGGKVCDEVASYTAMRKISYEKDAYGILRMCLNGKPLFHFGPLDQGWWPDGLYTAPTDEALAYDVIKTKDFGYNMIRKHVKVEPARWYYHCDRLGLLVWQDMPSGDGGNKWEPDTYGGGTDRMRTPQSKAGYYREWREIMDHCMSNPCVVVWVPFNEAWGQFDTEAVAEWTKNYDPSRLVNPASGGNHRPCGDMADVHSYPTPRFKIFDMRRVMVLGEFGGIGLPLEEHLWVKNRNWGYIQFKTTKELTDEYVKYARMLENYVKCGFSGAVYTQTTDVEIEVNGLMTYDREVVKVDENRIREANRRVIAAMTEE